MVICGARVHGEEDGLWTRSPFDAHQYDGVIVRAGFPDRSKVRIGITIHNILLHCGW